jgi:hypothetical protein
MQMGEANLAVQRRYDAKGRRNRSMSKGYTLTSGRHQNQAKRTRGDARMTDRGTTDPSSRAVMGSGSYRVVALLLEPAEERLPNVEVAPVDVLEVAVPPLLTVRVAPAPEALRRVLAQAIEPDSLDRVHRVGVREEGRAREVAVLLADSRAAEDGDLGDEGGGDGGRGCVPDVAAVREGGEEGVLVAEREGMSARLRLERDSERKVETDHLGQAAVVPLVRLPLVDADDAFHLGRDLEHFLEVSHEVQLERLGRAASAERNKNLLARPVVRPPVAPLGRVAQQGGMERSDDRGIVAPGRGDVALDAELGGEVAWSLLHAVCPMDGLDRESLWHRGAKARQSGIQPEVPAPRDTTHRHKSRDIDLVPGGAHAARIVGGHVAEPMADEALDVVRQGDEREPTGVGQRAVARLIIVHVRAPVRQAADVDVCPGVEQRREQRVDVERA